MSLHDHVPADGEPSQTGGFLLYFSHLGSTLGINPRLESPHSTIFVLEATGNWMQGEDESDTETRENESKSKRMKAEPFEERLRGIFSFHEAAPVVNESLSSIPVDLDHPSILFEWDLANVQLFVAAANAMSPPLVPPAWLRTRPPLMTAVSFIDDVVTFLSQYAGGRCGHVVLAPNNIPQYGVIIGSMCNLQLEPFVQQSGGTSRGRFTKSKKVEWIEPDRISFRPSFLSLLRSR